MDHYTDSQPERFAPGDEFVGCSIVRTDVNPLHPVFIRIDKEILPSLVFGRPLLPVHGTS